MTIKVGARYYDPELFQNFKVLSFTVDTVEVEDAYGYRRTVNRMMFETQTEVR